MSFLILAVILCVGAVTPVTVKAEDSLAVRPDVSLVSSRDLITYASHQKTAVRYRALVIDPLGADKGVVHLVLEKFFTDKNGNPDGVIYSKNFASTEFPLVKEAVAKLSRPQDKAGCCKINALTWDKGRMTFSVRVKEKSFSCKTDSLDAKKIGIHCQKEKP
jgi:hypothetical protein